MFIRAAYFLAICWVALFSSERLATAQTTLNPQPAFDQTPVTIKVLDVTYRIPRNYLISIGKIPTLKLTWPGLKPRAPETEECFGSINQGLRAGCASFEFHLLGWRGAKPYQKPLTHTEQFENFRRSFPAASLENGPFGYAIYSIGPPGALIEHYQRAEGDLYFNCFTSTPNLSLCRDFFLLADGNHMHFRFRAWYVGDVGEIEKGMRDLLASFVVPKE